MLLDDAWALQCADPCRLIVLCNQAVDLAKRDRDGSARFWAHLSRVLLASRYQPLDKSREDLESADDLSMQVPGPRAARLLDICDALLEARGGSHRSALDRLLAMSRGVTADVDDPDDYFILCGISQCASRLQRPDALFNSLYSNLLLTERTGPPIRHAAVAAELAAALISIGRAAEALELIEGRNLKVASRWNNPLLFGSMRIQAAIAKYAQGRAMDAHNDMLGLLSDGVADLTRGFAFQVHSNLMGVCIQRGLFDEANRCAMQAQAAAASTRRLAHAGVCHQGAGILAHVQGDGARAIELLEQAMACFEQDLPIIVPMNAHVDAGAVLAECHASQSRHELAYASHRRFFDIHRRRIDYTSRGQLAALKAQQHVAACIRLSDRELQCLSWSAVGKTAWETGKILNLSEWTVVYHLEKAKRKFGLTKKQEVIAHAISLGLIKPNRDCEPG